MNGGLFLDDPAGLLRPARLGMPFDDIEPFDNHSVFFQQHAEHFAGLAPLLAAQSP